MRFLMPTVSITSMPGWAGSWKPIRSISSSPDDYLERLEKRRPAAPQYLPRRGRAEDGGGRMVPRWNLILPEALAGRHRGR